MIYPFQSFNPNTFEFSDSLDGKLAPVSSIYLVVYKTKNKKNYCPPPPQAESVDLNTSEPDTQLNPCTCRLWAEIPFQVWTQTGARGCWGCPACAGEGAQGAGCRSAASRRPVGDRAAQKFYDSPQDYNISTMMCAGIEEKNQLINDWTGTFHF